MNMCLHQTLNGKMEKETIKHREQQNHRNSALDMFVFVFLMDGSSSNLWCHNEQNTWVYVFDNISWECFWKIFLVDLKLKASFSNLGYRNFFEID